MGTSPKRRSMPHSEYVRGYRAILPELLSRSVLRGRALGSQTSTITTHTSLWPVPHGRSRCLAAVDVHGWEPVCCGLHLLFHQMARGVRSPQPDS